MGIDTMSLSLEERIGRCETELALQNHRLDSAVTLCEHKIEAINDSHEEFKKVVDNNTEAMNLTISTLVDLKDNLELLKNVIKAFGKFISWLAVISVAVITIYKFLH